MFGVRNSISVSKLKSLSTILGCSFSLLRYSIRSASIQRNILNITKSHIDNFKILPLNIVKAFSTDLSVDHEDYDDPNRNINMQSITEGDEDLLKKLKVLMLEVEVLRQDGQRVPSLLSEEMWKELVSKPTRAQRIKQLKFWWLNEKKRESDKKKKKEAKMKREANIAELRKEKNTTNHIQYGIGGCTIFLRIYDSKIDNHNNQKLIQAMMFGQKLIVDCSYDDYMTPQEASLCAKQLCYMFAENRLNDNPFNLYFCNADKKSKVMKKLSSYIPTLYDEAFPLNITEKSYLDMFPKENLVYLTPHCRQNLKTYSHDDIYIIGAMVDKVNNDPLSLAKAKSLGLRMAKLPLDIYLDWGIGDKSLTLNQVQLILLEMKKSGDWKKALQHVPQRKLKRDNEVESKNNFYHLRKKNLIL